MPPSRVLILAGTREARDLAAALLATGYDVVSSLAGVTENPQLPPGRVRRGGFGGAQGLADFLRDEHIGLIADASHPFAAQISRHACQAAAMAGIAYARLERPPWRPGPGDTWLPATTVAEAVNLLPGGARVFLTIGRKEAGAFFARHDLSGVARMIESLPLPPPPQWQLLLARPPFSVQSEADIMRSAAITHLVAKNAGGPDGFAKCLAARSLGLPVVLVERPGKPDAPCFEDVNEFVRSAARLLLP